MIKTKAWVLHEGPEVASGSRAVEGQLVCEEYTFADLTENEVLIEPLYGTWEANLEHAISRDPVDICRQRREKKIVLGNGAVVRVLSWGSAVKSLTEGQVCLVMPFGKRDRFGFVEQVHAYDAPGTVGALAKRSKVHVDILLPITPNSRYSFKQWAPYGRYFTAWDNWNVALACWRSQMRDADPSKHLVFAWGGGVTFAELQLAKRDGFQVAMTASNDRRLAELERQGIIPIDRREFSDLAYDADTFKRDEDYRERYLRSEKVFTQKIAELSGGNGCSIVLDNLGGALYRATMKVLNRQGIISTCGWKVGMRLWNLRASECINRRLHVHTHVWRYQDCATIRDYMESSGWMQAPEPEDVYDFPEISRLASEYSQGKVESYFPVYQVNAA